MYMCIYVRLLHQYSMTSVLRGSIHYFIVLYCIVLLCHNHIKYHLYLHMLSCNIVNLSLELEESRTYWIY